MFLQGLNHAELAAVSKGGLNKLVLHTQVLEAVVEVGIGHLDGGESCCSTSVFIGTK